MRKVWAGMSNGRKAMAVLTAIVVAVLPFVIGAYPGVGELLVEVCGSVGDE